MSALLPLADFAEAPDLGARRTIPFDYAFRFDLRNAVPGSALQGKLTVSVEAAFVATAIGYGFAAEVTPIPFGQQTAEGSTQPQAVDLCAALRLLGDRLANSSPRGAAAFGAVLKRGFRINPRYVALLLQARDQPPSLSPGVLKELFETVGPPLEPVQFLYALFDEGSGRAFQSEPILNTAGLGSPDGRRPFRYFATPITFTQGATIRMEVTPLAEFDGDLHVSLHGYKILGGSGTPTDTRRRVGPGMR